MPKPVPRQKKGCGALSRIRRPSSISGPIRIGVWGNTDALKTQLLKAFAFSGRNSFMAARFRLHLSRIDFAFVDNFC